MLKARALFLQIPNMTYCTSENSCLLISQHKGEWWWRDDNIDSNVHSPITIWLLLASRRRGANAGCSTWTFLHHVPPHILYCCCKIFSPYNCQIFCNGCPQICLMWKIFFWKVQLCLLLFTSTRHPSKTGGRGQNSPYVKLFSSRYFFVKEVSSFFIVCLFLSLVLTYVCVNVGNLRPVNAVKKKTLAHWSHLGWTWFGSKPQEKLVDCAESEPYENLVYPWFAWTE